MKNGMDGVKVLMVAVLAFMAFGFMTGCKTKTSQAVVQPTKDYSDRDIATAARAGHRINLGVDAYNHGQISDKDLVEIRAQLHQSVMSSIAALKMLKDFNDAEEVARLEAGLIEAPMSTEQKAQRLTEIRKAIEDIRAREVEVARQKADAERAKADTEKPKEADKPKS